MIHFWEMYNWYAVNDPGDSFGGCNSNDSEWTELVNNTGGRMLFYKGRYSTLLEN
jgi:hypothetical protein